jgi:hypothetical protein
MGIMTNPPPIPAKEPKAPATLPINTDLEATIHTGSVETFEVVVEFVAEEASDEEDESLDDELLLVVVVRRCCAWVHLARSLCRMYGECANVRPLVELSQDATVIMTLAEKGLAIGEKHRTDRIILYVVSMKALLKRVVLF